MTSEAKAQELAQLRHLVYELRQALSDLWTQADEDCPSEYRTAHFREAMKNSIRALSASQPK